MTSRSHPTACPHRLPPNPRTCFNTATKGGIKGILNSTAYTAAEKRRAKPKLGRVAKASFTRQALFRAAAYIVGKRGYSDASVSLITQRAKVAQGTFYKHFENRQALLDSLLPACGDQMLAYLRRRIPRDAPLPQQEEESFLAFFEFLAENPGFHRVMNEAEFFAPEGHRRHGETLHSKYLRVLQKAWRRGELPGYDEHELGVVAQVLIALRRSVSMRFAQSDGKIRPPPAEVTRTILKFLSHGLFGSGR